MKKRGTLELRLTLEMASEIKWDVFLLIPFMSSNLADKLIGFSPEQIVQLKFGHFIELLLKLFDVFRVEICCELL